MDSEDLELVNMLQDLDDAGEQPVDTDSVMGTPINVNVEGETDFDDTEYSQAFNEETILISPYTW